MSSSAPPVARRVSKKSCPGSRTCARQQQVRSGEWRETEREERDEEVKEEAGKRERRKQRQAVIFLDRNTKPTRLLSHVKLDCGCACSARFCLPWHTEAAGRPPRPRTEQEATHNQRHALKVQCTPAVLQCAGRVAPARCRGHSPRKPSWWRIKLARRHHATARVRPRVNHDTESYPCHARSAPQREGDDTVRRAPSRGQPLLIPRKGFQTARLGAERSARYPREARTRHTRMYAMVLTAQ